jgi:hypothetical protein
VLSPDACKAGESKSTLTINQSGQVRVTKEPAHEPPQPGPPALVAGWLQPDRSDDRHAVLAFGLLGFALLQTMNVRFVQSANYRTQATNLANDLIELMRAQRTDTLAGGATSASFSAGSVKPSGACAWPTGAAVTPKTNVARWQCQVARRWARRPARR